MAETTPTENTSSTVVITQNQVLKKKQRLENLENSVNKVLDGITQSAKEPGWFGLAKSAFIFIVFIMAQSIIAKVASDQKNLAKEAYEAGQTQDLNTGNHDNLDG